MSRKIKPGLFFGIFMAVTFIAENLLSADVITTSDILISITIGIFAGVIAGLLTKELKLMKYTSALLLAIPVLYVLSVTIET